MSILIKGMDMPEFGEKIIILTSSGYVEDVSGQVIDGIEAVPVSPHGRLIDKDALLASYSPGLSRDLLEASLAHCPTVIPADPAEEGE